MKITQGQIDASDVTTRLLFPTSQQGPWSPFERFAETIATARKKEGLHSHSAEEVVVYVLEGYVDHDSDAGQPATLTQWSVLVLTAHESIRHELVMQKGRSARWMSIVLRLPWHAEPPPTSVQIKTAGDPIEAADGTVQRPAVGSHARADSFTHIECADIAFAKEGTAFFRLGQTQRSVAYVLSGSGIVGTEHRDPRRGAALESGSGFSLHGTPGSRCPGQGHRGRTSNVGALRRRGLDFSRSTKEEECALRYRRDHLRGFFRSRKNGFLSGGGTLIKSSVTRRARACRVSIQSSTSQHSPSLLPTRIYRDGVMAISAPWTRNIEWL